MSSLEWALWLGIILVTSGCAAASSAPSGDGKSAGREVAVSEPGASPKNARIEELLRRTGPDGAARVIVQLRIAPGPDDTREKRVKSAQQELLAELAPVPHQVLRTYTVTPALALEASHQALRILRDSPHVLSIEEDALAKPFNKSN